MKTVTLMGATGSVGASTLAVVEAGAFELVGLAGGSNTAALAEIALRHRPRFTVIADGSKGAELKAALEPHGLACGGGPAALLELAAMEADRVVIAIPGFAALEPALAAAAAGRTLCLANKECLVAAGPLVMGAAARHGATILPVDSEHNAIFQVYEAAAERFIRRIVLTASGGPFRTCTLDEMHAVTPAMALKHPNWSMGAKITIDSATMMNKGLEVIEAFHLYPVGAQRVGVVVHPESVVHGMVEYEDGSVLAQLSNPSMVTPIAHCLNWPERGTAPVSALDLITRGTLTFEAPDETRFPCLRLAREALGEGPAATNALNAANEVAVAAFLKGSIGFMQIAELVERTLTRMARDGHAGFASLDEVVDIDRLARHVARDAMTDGFASPA